MSDNIIKKKIFGDPTYYTEHELANEGFCSLGNNVKIAKNCTIVGTEYISIGDNVRIDGYCTMTAGKYGFINIGSFIHIGGYCVLLGGKGITMNNFSTLSWGVKIFTRSDDFSGHFMTNPTVPNKFTGCEEGEVMIGRHSIIGSETIVLPGSKLGDGVAVGALSMVNNSLEEWCIFAGIPARKLKTRSRNLLELEKEFFEHFGR